MGPSNRNEGKMGIGDIIFIVLLIIILILFIPFYSSTIEVLKLAANFMVGVDTYIGLLGAILGIFMLSLGFKHGNSAIKIFGLLLMAVFLLNPFYGYLGKRDYLKKSLGNYTFKGLTVVQPDGCQLEQQVQTQMLNTWSDEFGSELDVDTVETTPSSTSDSWKDKIKCMAVETHYVYQIAYKDAYGEERVISYDGADNFEAMLKVQSYEILYEKVGEYLKEIEGIGKITYQFKIAEAGKGLLSLDRSSVVSEGIIFPTPNKITLKNFYQDKRVVLEIQFENLTDKTKIENIVKELESKSENEFPIIVYYGKKSEYYYRGIWSSLSEQELITKLKGNE